VRNIQTLSLLAAVLLLAPLASAHHSPAAFDMGTTVTVRGEVTRFDWKNPHVYIRIEGTDGAGHDGEWLIEGDPTPLMSRSGWTSSTLAEGDTVSLTISPDRDRDNRHGLLRTLTTADGVTLSRRSGRTSTTSRATSIAGKWNALAHFGPAMVDQDTDPPRSYTPAGLAAREQFDLTQIPTAECLAYPTPMITVLPYLNEIEIRDDRVLIHSEFFDIVRTVYTDGRDHPADGERTIQGHSIGHWEGTTLVVDTRLYADYRLMHGWGIPSGAQKHTLERFALASNGTQLAIEVFVEDPEFVIAPYTVTTMWDYAPDDPFEASPCDPENASQFTR
jgi:hypothetical protein